MASRRITPEDYQAIATNVLSCIDMLENLDSKAIYSRLDAHRVMTHIITSENAWLVDESYLVVFSVVTPWYAPLEILDIREELVLKLKPEADFSCVPAFLEQRRETEGASLVAVGTSLAKSDSALAAKYEQHGFRTEAYLLIKEA